MKGNIISPIHLGFCWIITIPNKLYNNQAAEVAPPNFP